MITVRVLPSAKLHSTLLPNCHGEVMDGGAVAAAAVGVIAGVATDDVGRT